MRQIGRIACALSLLVVTATAAYAQAQKAPKKTAANQEADR